MAAAKASLTRSSISLLRSRAWIGGAWATAADGKTFPVFDPCTGKKIVDVPDMRAEDAKIAVMEAHKSKKIWAGMLAWDRSKILKNFYGLLMDNQDDLAVLVSLETGKPLGESRVEVAYGASFVEWFAEEARRLYGDIIPSPVKGRRLLVTKNPIGVAGLITPWNFPVAMILRKAGAALAAGCTCVVKPSEETPLSALAIAELSQQASIPPGVFNVISSSRQNSPEVGKVLCTSDLVQKISFTGSTATGKLLLALSADTVKKLSLELGGNAPHIVFDSADVELAVRGLMAAKFRNTGQACISSNRILVQAGIHDKFVEAFSEAVSRLKLGDAFEEGVTQGPLINKLALDKVESLVEDAVSRGAKVNVGGSRDHALGDLFYRPSILTGATPDMRMSREEIFGPIAPITRFEKEEEAISIANNTNYGLASYIFSSDMGQVFRVSEAMESGIVGVNEGAVSSAVVPFGGVKQSGFGREGSKYGMDDYVYLKYICIGGLN